jgi:hypothetical protein
MAAQYCCTSCWSAAASSRGWLPASRDPRAQDQVTYGLAELLRTVLVLFGLGWRDQDDADEEQRFDLAVRVAIAEAHGTAALSDYHLPSQPTLSRLLGTLSQLANLAVLRQAVGELAAAAARDASWPSAAWGDARYRRPAHRGAWQPAGLSLEWALSPAHVPA